MSPLKIEAIIPVPTTLIDTKEVERELAAVLDKVIKSYAIPLLKRTTTTWKEPRPVFKQKKARWISTYAMAADIVTEDQRFIWVDQGTKPHRIRIKRAPYLVFQTGYNPKTRVRTFASYKGGKYGPWAKRIEVQHPGTEAREFTLEVSKRIEDKFERDAAGAMKKLAQRSGRNRTRRR